MRRFGAYAIGLVLAVSFWTGPAGAQDKYTMGMARGT
jgi:hypothetical protein